MVAQPPATGSERATVPVSGSIQRQERQFTGTAALPASGICRHAALIIELHDVVVPIALKDASRVATCLVAFTGRFTTSNVEKGWSPTGTAGRIAIVVVRQHNLELLATVVLGRVPPRLVFARVFPRLR